MRVVDGQVQKIQDEIDKLTKKQKERTAVPKEVYKFEIGWRFSNKQGMGQWVDFLPQKMEKFILEAAFCKEMSEKIQQRSSGKEEFYAKKAAWVRAFLNFLDSTAISPKREAESLDKSHSFCCLAKDDCQGLFLPLL